MRKEGEFKERIKMINLTDQISQMLGSVIGFLPELVVAIVILILGYVVAAAVKSIIVAALRRIRLNRRIFEAPPGSIVRKISEDPTELIGSLVYWILWIIVISIAILALNVPVLNQLITAMYAYIPNIAAAVIILALAIAVSAGIATLTNRLIGDTPTGRVIATVLPTLILTVSVFMILVQLKIATSIVIITYAAIMGALALGFGLSFGLGGQGVASRILEQAYRRGQDGLDQARRDMETARRRGEAEVEKLKDRR